MVESFCSPMYNIRGRYTYVCSVNFTAYYGVLICTITLLVCSLTRWEGLLTVTEERKVLLEGAEHVHQFVRDVDETSDRMNDKVCMEMCFSL